MLGFLLLFSTLGCRNFTVVENLNLSQEANVEILGFSTNRLLSTNDNNYAHHVEVSMAISDEGTIFVGWKNSETHNGGGARVSGINQFLQEQTGIPVEIFNPFSKASIDSGFARAYSAIIDSNITTFITGIILYQFGTGPIQGFALTLMIGIGASLFSALVITRVILDIMVAKNVPVTVG